MDDIERLTLADEIRHVMARYVRCADHQRWQDLAGLFTPTGTFTHTSPARSPGGTRRQLAATGLAAARSRMIPQSSAARRCVDRPVDSMIVTPPWMPASSAAAVSSTSTDIGR